MPTLEGNRVGGALALVLAFLGLSTATASGFSLHRNFAPLASPCAPGVGINGFAVSGSRWLALCSTPSYPQQNSLRRSPDAGRTWSDVALSLADGQQGGPATAPDGRFAIVRDTGSGTELDRIDPATGAVSPTPGPPVSTDLMAAQPAPPAWDAGAALVAFGGFRQTTAVLSVWRQAADGSWSRLGEATPPDGLSGDLAFLRTGGATYLRDAEDVFKVSPAGLTQVPGVPLPFAGVTNTPAGVSLDGGATTAVPGVDVVPVEGDPTSFLVDGAVVQPFGSAMLGATGMRVPGGALRVLRVAGGYVAVSQGPSVSAKLAFAPDGPLPGTSATFAGWLSRANALRAQADLPPLVADAGITRAAENHSRYWTFNPAPGAILGYHEESPGNPGFTGVEMEDRCAAVGAFCNSEIMFPGESHPIDGWVATVYHRGLIMDPTSAVVGGGLVGDGPAVMDGGRTAGMLIAPTGFPRGAYSGPLAFGGEAPDPAVACRHSGQPAGTPFGTTVTAWAPSGTLTGLSVRPRGGAALPGCVLGGSYLQLGGSYLQPGWYDAAKLNFLPASPLAPHTTYDASVSWHPTGSAATRLVSWSFTTGDGPAPDPTSSGSGTPCRATLHLVRKRVHRGRSLRIRYRSCRRARLTVRVAQLRHGRRAKLRLRRTWTVSAPRLHGTHAIPTRRLPRGRYKVIARLSHAHHKWRVRVAPRACHTTLRLVHRRVRRGRALHIRYRACAPGRLGVRVSRRHAGRRPTLRLRRTARVPARRLHGSFAVSTHSLAAGRYTLTAGLARAHRRWRVRIAAARHR